MECTFGGCVEIFGDYRDCWQPNIDAATCNYTGKVNIYHCISFFQPALLKSLLAVTYLLHLPLFQMILSYQVSNVKHYFLTFFSLQ